MTKEKLIKLINDIADKIEENKDYLTDLDSAIADGDHGINMARGFSAVKEKLRTVEDKDCGTILKTVGMTLVSTVGGAAGPLYGTAFMKAGMAVQGKEEISGEDFIKMMEEAINGVKMRGKSEAGEKTMLDSMIPAYDAFKEGLNGGAKSAMEKALKASADGVEYTKTIKATKGRASYIGDRSIGHQDPGATSFTYIMECINDII
ncbi:dihydroxyacetone kinase subunit DhaL [Anaerofustis stercorihominis]|uniref:dihydroxyacetone kinase subunit DhaL n=1 Tax=Anaerofustis stercorihominis TaxID=214853 RepID=UPI00214CED03|nr:dihydroxyacetone kinase subunit DhaL [Anaerofustis stercorihominis]MCR2033106.1 dihydroxyacetone kinase subunit DhaL [Anaerofustis stercorihominis]